MECENSLLTTKSAFRDETWRRSFLGIIEYYQVAWTVCGEAALERELSYNGIRQKFVLDWLLCKRCF
jgi:hypothetical protein